GGGDGVGCVPLLGQGPQRDRVELDLGKDVGVPVAPAWVAVDLRDELLDGVHTVRDDLGRLAASGGGELAAHDQQAEVVPEGEPLDHDIGGVFGRVEIGGEDLLAGRDIGDDAPAVVAVPGF